MTEFDINLQNWDQQVGTDSGGAELLAIPLYLYNIVRMIPALRFLHKRQANLEPEEDISATTEALLIEEPETGVTLGQILGL